ncbi:hypothetical protein CERSUDRAFT_80552 [Gelatoporia subvermispora B]|uniref:N-acetyltransferase domain-containing protein n=1 Tax=Ceriporiopsis subvermispora (strain B) TaxID=914234 RepID=M2RR30_CERS8|nr:hypothetical protein CERSUDRAFT_80552 [Gelatoporia subvermispora B]
MASVEGFLRLYEPERLRYSHLPKVTQTALDAVENDPLQRYMLDTPDAHKARFLKLREKIGCYLNYSPYIHKKQAYTINGGDAMMLYDPAPNVTPKPSPLDRLLSKILQGLGRSLKVFDAPEQRKRKAEFITKHGIVAKEAIGDAVKEMIVLEAIATAPSQQRQGYGTMLVHIVTAMADEQGRYTWVTSSNIANTGFYESFGFRTVAEIAMGAENPTWKDPPVIVRIMVRSPTQSAFKPHNENKGVEAYV